MTPTRRALLTGATGFVGRHLSRRLLADGWEVAALVRDPRSPRIVPGIGAHVVPDEHGALVDLVAAVDPEVCIHLATYFVGDHRTADVRPLVDANLTFGTRLADALVGVGGIPLVNTGTAWQHVGGAPYAPMSLYAATKQAFADILRFHATRRHLEVVTLTLTDTYGPGDDRPKLVPALLAAGLTGGPLDLSTGDQLIDLVHVDDVVAAFARVVDLLRGGPAVSPSGDTRWAVSSGRPVTIRDLVDRFSAATGLAVDARWGVRPPRDVEMREPWAIGDAPPGWTPTTDLDRGLAALVAG